MKYEIITLTLEETKKAQQAGANRVELIAAFDQGGLTPSMQTIQHHQGLSIEVNVMVRPHARSFIYSEEEFQHIKKTTQNICALDIDGIVFGSLTQDRTIAENQLAQIREITHHYKKNLTFHRAFDELTDYTAATETLNAHGITTLLSSGTKSNAVEGKEILLAIKEIANFTVMPGAGIKSSNRRQFKDHFDYLHIGTGARSPEVFNGDLVERKMKALITG